MPQFEYKVTDPLGLHARPAGVLVKAAMGYDCSISVACRGKTADAKRMLAMMGLAVKCGDVVTVTFDGDDQDAARAAIFALFENSF